MSIDIQSPSFTGTVTAMHIPRKLERQLISRRFTRILPDEYITTVNRKKYPWGENLKVISYNGKKQVDKTCETIRGKGFTYDKIIGVVESAMKSVANNISKS
ncbi:MAG: hypothetical protein LBJ74_01150 [Heliobacteriaceae bacterium]|jgi:hypothetical protein|nr:hypothetical protein [Heliobacteriaceae bacterium]